MNCIKLFLSGIFVFILFTGHSLDFYWTNADNANSKWNNPGNWYCSDPTINTYPNNINNHNAYFSGTYSTDNCVSSSLIQVKNLFIEATYNGELSINDVFIVRDLLKVENPSAKIIAPSSDYIGLRGSVSLENGGNFEHNSGKVIFFGGMHNISVVAGPVNPWVLHDVLVTKGAASGAYVYFVLNTGEVEIHGTTTLGAHPSTGIFFKSGLFMLKGDCIINNVTGGPTMQDGGLKFIGAGDQTIQNTGASSGYPATIAGAIGRIEVDKPMGSTLFMVGSISVMRELKIKSPIDASMAALVLNMVSGGSYPDPTFSCRLNLDVPLTVPYLAINPAQNSGLKIIGDLTVTDKVETRGFRRINFEDGIINLEGTLHHNNYFAYSTSGDLMGNGLIRFSGSSTQTMTRTPAGLREFKGMLPNLEIDNPNGVEINGLFVVDGNINFHDGHFSYAAIDPNTNMLGLKQHGTVTNANDYSYVKGPFRQFGERLGSNTFDFPVGQEVGDDKYRPIRINNLNLPNSNNPRAYTGLTARYFLEDPNVKSSNLSSDIGSITDCEYWQLEEYYSAWAGIAPYSFTCNVGLSWYSNLNDNCDNDFYEFAGHVAGLDYSGVSAADEWVSEGNGGVFTASPDYDMIPSASTVASLNKDNDNYFTIGSDLIPCPSGPGGGVPQYVVCKSNGTTDCLPITALSGIINAGGYLGPCNPTLMKNASSQKERNPAVVYPNPFDERFTINFNSDQPVSIIIQDLLGNVIQDHRNIQSPDFSVGMTEYTPGFYTYSIYDSNGLLHSGKIIKRQ